MGAAGFHPVAVLVVNVAGGVAAIVAAGLVARRQRFGPASLAVIAGLLLTAVWSVVVAATDGRGLAVEFAQTARDAAWLVAVYRLFAADGRHASLAPTRPVLIVLALVEVLQLTVALVLARTVPAGLGAGIAQEFTVICRLLVAVGALVLVHNLYAGASRQSQAMLRWPATGLAVLWVFDLNLYTVAYLADGWPAEIAAGRGFAAFVLATLVAIGAAKGGEALRIRPSRAVTFQTFSLLVIGAYLIAMVGIAQSLSYAGGDFARLVELGFLIVASAVAVLVLPSRRMRGWVKVTLAKHFFQHRYDYREEWLRFTRTIGNGGERALPLGERVVQAVGDIAEAPAGVLLAPGDSGDLTLAARWQWGALDVPGTAMTARSASFFEREGFIVDLDDVRAGRDIGGAVSSVPSWLIDEPRAWAMVPLIHYERLVGMVVLARPQAPRRFDWEDFDLLRVVGRQLASYLAEHAGQEALLEASRFDDFNRRIAFVMHDIKNLASQLSLLAHNAELHAAKPAFRADMLVTLRNSADKLNTLLARLSRYGGSAIDRLAEIDAPDVARAVVRDFQATGQVMLAECQPCTVMANRESLEQLLVHVVQNAVDASAPGAPVFLSLACEPMHARFEVIDSGSGMSPEFVRTKLFKPFESSKPGGFGIGAFEARELVRAMHGRLEVESREGLGSRFVIRLPLAAVTELFGHRAQNAQGAQRLAS